HCLYLYSLVTPPPTTASYTLSLHDALPISPGTTLEHYIEDLHGLTRTSGVRIGIGDHGTGPIAMIFGPNPVPASRLGLTPEDYLDRKSTRLNSSHVKISYAVFCLKKKKKK